MLTVSLITTIVGAVVYLVTPHAKATELGRIAYFVGLLWLICALGGHAVRFG